MHEDLVLTACEAVSFPLEREVLHGAPESSQTLDYLI